MRTVLALILLLMAGAALAVDQRLNVPGIIPPLGGTGRDQQLIPDQGGAVPPVSCDGSIDLSKGCAMPMLGGL